MAERKIDPKDILVPPGFTVDVLMQGLTTPIDMEFAADGSLYVGDAGITSGSGKVLRIKSGGEVEVVAEGFNPPLTGITLYKRKIYVAHKATVSVLREDGTRIDILKGLPSFGDHQNNKVVFSGTGRMYFGQGTATNSGVVGPDSGWLTEHPYFHDMPGAAIRLNAQNFPTADLLSSAPGTVYTGPYSPYGVPAVQGETIQGSTRASGSILSANDDGSDLKLVAWGLRNPFRIRFDKFGRLLCANHGADVRGSRPINNAPDEFHIIHTNTWYGWPDYAGGIPVALPAFKPDNGPQPGFLLASHPMRPPKPFACFSPHSAIMGFDFNRQSVFPGYGDVYIAEYGSEAPISTGGKPLPKVGHRVSILSMETGQISTFAINRSLVAASEDGGGGFERPIDAKFGPDGSLYVADFGQGQGGSHEFTSQTGLIWRISRT